MKIVYGDEVALRRGLEHRGGTFHDRRLMAGEPGRLDNFELSYDALGGDFYSPRHRHNFEQIRYQLAGELDYARDGKLKTGMVGYFPEGVPYGPQTQAPDAPCVTIVLQCGGASGSGYLSRDEVLAGRAALAAQGVFEDGVFRRHAGEPGRKNVDGYQAIWEHVNGRPLTYPSPRYDRPILIDPGGLDWLAIDDATEAAEKPLGRFTECETSVRLLRLSTAGRYRLAGRGIYLVLAGEGAFDGVPYRHLTCLFVDRDDDVMMTASTVSDVLHFGLPDLTKGRLEMAAQEISEAAPGRSTGVAARARAV